MCVCVCLAIDYSDMENLLQLTLRKKPDLNSLQALQRSGNCLSSRMTPAAPRRYFGVSLFVEALNSHTIIFEIGIILNHGIQHGRRRQRKKKRKKEKKTHTLRTKSEDDCKCCRWIKIS